MATQAQLEALDQAHRTRQAANAAAVVVAMNAAWNTTMQPTSIAATGRQWLAQVIDIIASGRRRSGLLALAYAQQTRTLQVPSTPRIDLPTVPDMPVEQIQTSMVIQGLKITAIELARTPARRELPAVRPDASPEQVEALQRDADSLPSENAGIDRQIADVMKRARERAAATAVRVVQNGGRDAIDEVVKSDLKARGFIRITRANCCFWCAMLASRGPVYSEDSFDESNARFTGSGNHKVHDNCGCSLRPVYTRDGSEWTETARIASDLWESGPASLSGKAAIAEFRRLWTQRQASAA